MDNHEDLPTADEMLENLDQQEGAVATLEAPEIDDAPVSEITDETGSDLTEIVDTLG